MAVLDIRQRTGWLFGGLIVAHIVLISTQVKTRGVPLFEVVTFGAFAEVQRWATSVVSGVQDTWTNYFALQQVRAENERLRRENAELQIRLQGERAEAQQARTLQELLELRGRHRFLTTGAGVTTTPLVESSVIGGGASPSFRTITIDKGTQDGVRADMAVIAPRGVVGRVVLPTARASKVQLLIDGEAGAGALMERSRAQGVIEGTGEGLRLVHVPGTADIKVGDVVVTSGIEGFYPKGLVIGQIQSIERTAGEFSQIAVRPAAEYSTLEAVLVVLTPPSADAGDGPAEAKASSRDTEAKASPADRAR
jgi:rod shape-determining protein MreC